MTYCGDQSQPAQVEARMTTEEPMPKLEQPKNLGTTGEETEPKNSNPSGMLPHSSSSSSLPSFSSEGNKANDKYPDASTAAPGQQQEHNENKGMLDKIKEMLPGMS